MPNTTDGTMGMNRSKAETVDWLQKWTIVQNVAVGGSAAQLYVDRDQVLDVGNAYSVTFLIKVWARIDSTSGGTLASFDVTFQHAEENSDLAFETITGGGTSLDVSSTSNLPYTARVTFGGGGGGTEPKRYFRLRFEGHATAAQVDALLSFSLVAQIHPR